MARINIEDTLFRDKRFLNLCVTLGSSTVALGSLVEAWIVAQEFWRTSTNGIPRDEWKCRDLNDALIECGLAEDRGDFIYMRGSETQFKWLSAASRAGKLGGKSNARLRGNHSGKIQATLEQPSNDLKPLTLTPTLTLSPTLSPAPALSQKQRVPAAQNDSRRETWECYASSFKKRYGVEPVRNATVNAQIASLTKRLGKESPQVVEFYLSHNAAFYVSKMHPIGLCLSDAEKLYAEWKTGARIFSSTAREVERVQKNSDVFAQAEKFLKARKKANDPS